MTDYKVLVVEDSPTMRQLIVFALKRIREAVGAQYPLFYDTGLRSGEDVVKAYHMGADFVFFGRAMQFAIAAGGPQGLAAF